MLILFSVSNYRSFYKEQELSLVAEKASRNTDSTHLIHTKLPDLSGKAYLRAAAIYGANGSGKSNLTHALATMQSIVLNSSRLSVGERLPYEPFSLNERAASEPTTFFLPLSGTAFAMNTVSATSLTE